MPIILVVDDSETDRALIDGLLRPKLDWIVQFAEDGAEAYEMIGQIFPDVVVTDLQMPNMNGIQLCSEAKAEYPTVPIILITGKGSEELALEALDAGAVSYVPKSALAGSLLETVEQVLAISKCRKSQGRLMEYSTSNRYQFNLENDQSLIFSMIDFVRFEMEKLGLGDRSDQRHVAVAIEEALLNAMFHGNLELDGTSVQDARRAFHDGEIADAVKERLANETFASRRVKVGIDISRSRIEMIVRDGGQGFDTVTMLEHASEPSQLSGAGGRGLTLIRKFMDQLQFNESGNEIRMSLRLKHAPQVQAPERLLL